MDTNKKENEMKKLNAIIGTYEYDPEYGDDREDLDGLFVATVTARADENHETLIGHEAVAFGGMATAGYQGKITIKITEIIETKSIPLDRINVSLLCTFDVVNN